VKKIELAVEKKGYRFSALVDGIVNSAPFQMRHAQAVGTDNNQRANIRPNILEPTHSASASRKSGQ